MLGQADGHVEHSRQQDCNKITIQMNKTCAYSPLFGRVGCLPPEADEMPRGGGKPFVLIDFEQIYQQVEVLTDFPRH